MTDELRELDRMVAEKVMGWQLAEAWTPGSQEPWWRKADGWMVPLPPFTTDIAAAWQVVERMRELGWYYGVSGSISIGEIAMFRVLGDAALVRSGTASTAPEAICRAALAALETGEPNLEAVEHE